MTEISKDIETPDFVKPDSVVEVAIEKGSNPPALPSDSTPKENIVTELFVKGTEPNTVSEKFDELDPVSDLSASYNEPNESIDVSWSYNDEDDVDFEVAYKIDDGDFKQLTTTSDLAVEITEVDVEASYTIQVTAVKESARSEPRSTTVNILGEDEQDDEEDEESIPPVEGLNASYNEANSSISASWQYNGPSAQFEVDINGEKQTVQSNNIQINGVSSGGTYTITVTPIVNGNRGASQSTTVTVEAPADNDQDGSNNDNNDGDGDDENEDEDEDDKNEDDSDEEEETEEDESE